MVLEPLSEGHMSWFCFRRLNSNDFRAVGHFYLDVGLEQVGCQAIIHVAFPSSDTLHEIPRSIVRY